MWRRLRRRTMAPSRPILHPGQVVLAALTLVVLVSSIVFVLVGVL